MITRRDWWIGVALVTAAILVHALVPRYEYQHPAGSVDVWFVVDRWTGHAEIVQLPYLE